MRRSIHFAALALASCGARTELDLQDLDEPPADVRPPEEPVEPAPSCWAEPNCVEAELRFDDRVQPYAQIGEVGPTPRVLWLDSLEANDVLFRIKLFRRAEVGVHPWDPNDGDVFVTLQVGDRSCVLLDDVVLTEADTLSGLTIGEFSGGGPTAGCPDLSVSVTGRFRLTAP